MAPPDERFADAALRLSGQCALGLGWRPDEFWDATPAEVVAIFAASRAPQDAASVSRGDLNRMMEQDDG